MFLPALLVVSLVSSTPPDRVELVFGGDIIPHGAVQKSVADHALVSAGDASGGGSSNHEGWDFLFEPLSGVLRGADVAVVNLETPLSGDPRAPTGPLIFDASPMLAHALVAAGVDAVSMANNHAFDQRRAGVAATWARLDAAGLAHVGSAPTEAMAWEPLVLERKGLRVGLLSLTRWLNGASNPKSADEAPQVAYVSYARESPVGLTPEQAAALVASATRRCDALIVLVHWGTEYSHTPHPEDRALAQRLVDAGALAVVGHHPHVLQPVEHYRTSTGRDALVAFSLGNLVANQGSEYVYGVGPEDKARRRDSMLLRLSLSRPGPGAPVEIVDSGILPVWIDNDQAVSLRDREHKLRVQPVLIDEELARLEGQLATLSTEDKSRAALAKRRELEQRRGLAHYRRDVIQRVTQLPPPVQGAGRRVGTRVD